MSQTLKTWDGLRVCSPDWYPKHPQLMVRGRVDRQAVIDGRPEPTDIFIDDGSGVDNLCQPSQVVPSITVADLKEGVPEEQ
jgi:hypothetical protein